MSFAIWRSHFGLSRETTYGATGALGMRYIPPLSFNPGWEDDLERIVDKGIRGAGSMDFAMYTGTQKSRGGYEHYFYPDNCGVFLYGIFGNDVVSGATAPFTHTFGVSTAQPPSYTLYDYAGLVGNSSETKLVGAQLERVELNYTRSNGALVVKPTWLGFASTGIAETTDTYTTEAPFRGWEAVMSIAGTTNTRLIDFNVIYARTVDLIYGGSNTQAPNAREVGPLEVTGSFAAYASTGLEYDRYVSNSTGALSVVMTDSTNSITFQITDFRIEKTSLDRGGNYARWNCNFRGLHSATDSGPAIVSLVVQSSCSF